MLTSMRKSKNRYFYHILVSPGDAPGAITLNVACMEREFDAYRLSRSMYPSILNSFPVKPQVLSLAFGIYCSERISILLLLTLMVTYLLGSNTSIESKQLSRYITLINSDSFDSTAESPALSKLYSDFALLQPLFQRLFCVPASSAPVERVFSQSGLIMFSH